MFDAANPSDVKKYRINEFNCLKDNDWEIFGNFYRAEMKYLELKLWKCQNATATNTKGPGITAGVLCED
jgi:hypothetical protein